MTTVGLMTDDLREVDARRASIPFTEPVHRIRIFDGLLWIVTDREIRGYAHRDGLLELTELIDVGGARDIDRLDDNRAAIAGAFGRAVYRFRSTDEKPGRTRDVLAREPSALERAQFDGRRVRAAGPLGAWQYSVGSEEIKPIEEPVQISTSGEQRATTLWVNARIDETRRSVVMQSGSREQAWSEARGAKLHCLIAIDGTIWVGHDNGVTVLRGHDPDPTAVIGELRLDGPVRYLFPLLGGGGAVYVAEQGGIGVARFNER